MPGTEREALAVDVQYLVANCVLQALDEKATAAPRNKMERPANNKVARS